MDIVYKSNFLKMRLLLVLMTTFALTSADLSCTDFAQKVMARNQPQVMLIPDDNDHNAFISSQVMDIFFYIMVDLTVHPSEGELKS